MVRFYYIFCSINSLYRNTYMNMISAYAISYLSKLGLLQKLSELAFECWRP